MTPAQAAWLRLLRTPRLGASAIVQGVEQHGSAETWVASRERPPRLPEAVGEADARWLARPRRQLVCWDSEDYPSLLRRIDDPPAALWVIGDATALWLPQLAIVGSRHASAGGLALARDFAATLTRSGLAITSGLAQGVDGAAHQACLQAQGQTIAVLGHGLDRIYPREHQSLAEAIASAGALVSEYPPGTAPRPGLFPRRNRLIAGLALGTLVVEAGLNSGSLITARLASEAGREVFAIPGSIHNPLAKGCHRLIREGAKLVESAQEIHEELAPLARVWADQLRGHLSNWEDAPTSAVAGDARAAAQPSDPDYDRVRQALGFDPVSIDELVSRTALTVAELSSMLLKMELDGEVSTTPGGRYSRKHERG
ncbi:MAG: DNA-processing protein DprA [Xanthomonadales bacterium]|nr:DNA-processing protein DprA [Xanthomonadales bacterium]